MSGGPGRGALKDVNSGLESVGQRTKGSPTKSERIAEANATQLETINQCFSHSLPSPTSLTIEKSSLYLEYKANSYT